MILRHPCAVAVLALMPAVAAAQTDYYNTDRHRPLRIEDPYPTERYSFDFHLAPVRVTRAAAGAYAWSLEPELAWGALPRTHLEIGLPVRWQDAPPGGAAGLAGVELSVLHALNIETRGLPGLGFRATAAIPAGPFGPDRVIPSIQGNLTRTLPAFRVHVNAEYSFGDEQECPASPCESEPHPRWMAGIGLDKAFPLAAFLLGAEVFAERPMDGDELTWVAGVGTRYQLDPVWSLDAGAGIRFEEDVYPWHVTFGFARVFGVRWLMPGGAR